MRKFKKLLTPRNIILALILITAAILRVYHTETILGFWYDQGRDALVIWDFWHKGKLFLIGPTTGIAGIFRGPWYYWLIAPVYLIAGGNPSAVAIFLALTTVVAIYYLFKIGEKLGGVKVGLLAALIASLSFYMVTSARWLSNPTPMFLVSMLTIWFLIKFTEGKKHALAAIAFLTGMAIQFGSAAEVFYIPAILIVLWMYRKKIGGWKKLIMPGLIFFTVFIPQIAFNIRHQGIFMTAVKKFLFEDESFKLSFWQMLKVRAPFYYDMLASKFWINGAKLFTPFLITAGLSLVLNWKKLWKNSVFKIIFIFSLAPLIGMLFFQGNYGNVYEYYFTGYYFIFILLISYLLITFSKNIIGKVVLVLFLGIFLVRCFKTTLPYVIGTGNDEQSAIYFSNQKQILDWVYEDAQDETFNVDVYVPPVIPYAYDYLFKWYGGSVKGREPEQKQTSRLYTIYEIDPPHPERLDAWLKRQEKIGKIEKETRSGGIIVQRRLRLKYD